MKLLPAFIRQLVDLPWNADITPEDYQRLTIRYILAFLYFSLIIAAAGLVMFMSTMALDIYAPAFSKVAQIVMGVIGGVAVVAGFIYFFLLMLKLATLRLRNLGLTKFEAIGLQIGTLVISMVPGIYLAAHTSDTAIITDFSFMPVLQYLMLIFIPLAVLQYWLYFETTPLCRSVNPETTLKPLAGVPKRGETISLFLLQTYVWYSVLKTPLDVIFPY